MQFNPRIVPCYSFLLDLIYDPFETGSVNFSIYLEIHSIKKLLQNSLSLPIARIKNSTIRTHHFLLHIYLHRWNKETLKNYPYNQKLKIRRERDHKGDTPCNEKRMKRNLVSTPRRNDRFPRGMARNRPAVAKGRGFIRLFLIRRTFSTYTCAAVELYRKEREAMGRGGLPVVSRALVNARLPGYPPTPNPRVERTTEGVVYMDAGR